jgi:hypothetical protein
MRGKGGTPSLPPGGFGSGNGDVSGALSRVGHGPCIAFRAVPTALRPLPELWTCCLSAGTAEAGPFLSKLLKRPWLVRAGRRRFRFQRYAGCVLWLLFPPLGEPASALTVERRVSRGDGGGRVFSPRIQAAPPVGESGPGAFCYARRLRMKKAPGAVTPGAPHVAPVANYLLRCAMMLTGRA